MKSEENGELRIENEVEFIYKQKIYKYYETLMTKKMDCGHTRG
jgi:hypothetical protein